MTVSQTTHLVVFQPSGRQGQIAPRHDLLREGIGGLRADDGCRIAQDQRDPLPIRDLPEGVEDDVLGRDFAEGELASPPVGELRWKAPQPVVPWSGRAVTSFFNVRPSMYCITKNSEPSASLIS